MTDQQQPGPELDAAVFRALGHDACENADCEECEHRFWLNDDRFIDNETDEEISPSHNIADAMRAAVAMEPRGFTWGVLRRNNLASTRAFFIGPKAELTNGDVNLADTNGDILAALCLAICRAIVAAGEK